MSQVVGADCARCGQRISSVLDGGLCGECGAPVHTACARDAGGDAEACGSCGARRRAKPAPAAPAPPQATQRQVLGFGLYLLLGGGLLFVLGEGWTVNGIPVRWVGVAMAVFGLWMLVSPGRRRTRERVGRLLEAEPTPADLPEASSAPTDVEGEYATPVFAIRERPYPVTGRGRMRTSRAGIEITAQEVGTSARSLAMLAAVVVVVMVVLLAGLLEDFRWLIVLLAAPAIWLPFRKARERGGAPVTLTIPWANIASFRPDENGPLLIDIKGTNPRGVIHFIPEGGPDPIVATLSAHRIPASATLGR